MSPGSLIPKENNHGAPSCGYIFSHYFIKENWQRVFFSTSRELELLPNHFESRGGKAHGNTKPGTETRSTSPKVKLNSSNRPPKANQKSRQVTHPSAPLFQGGQPFLGHFKLQMQPEKSLRNPTPPRTLLPTPNGAELPPCPHSAAAPRLWGEARLSFIEPFFQGLG